MTENQPENDDMWCGICKRTSTNSLDHDAEAHAAWAAQPQTENDDMWCGICKRTSTNSLDHDAEAHAAWAAQPQTESDECPEDGLACSECPDYCRATYPEPDYVDCTCGHPNDDHESGVCPFKGCGCGALYDDSDVTSPPARTGADQ